MAEPKPMPNPRPDEEDLNDPRPEETNLDRDGRERYPNEQDERNS